MVSTWRVVLATTVIFGAGVLVGGVLISHPDRVRERHRRPPGAGLPSWHPQRKDFAQSAPGELQPTLDGRRVDFVLSVHRELNLTPEQRERVEKVVREGQERTKTLWESIAPKLRKEMQDVKDKIRAELTPEQEARFEELLKQRPPRKPEEEAGQDRRQPKRAQPQSNAPPATPLSNP